MPTSGQDAVPQCRCGTAVFIKKTSECRRCYMRRRSNERTAAARAGSCLRCGETPVYAVRTGLCRWCHASGRPLSLTYECCHSRIRSWRGPASAHTCPCGAPAVEWAYRGDQATQRVSGLVLRDGKRKRMAWSPNPADYDALCRRCHGQRDRTDYGRGYRSSQATLRAKQREWGAATYARSVATDAGRAAYRERKRAEKQRRQSRQSGERS